MSERVPQSRPRWAHSVSHTRVTVERGIKFGIDQNRDAHSDSLIPYETFSKKLLWPTVLTSWHLSWMGKLFQSFQVTTL